MQIHVIPKTNDEFVRHWRAYVAERVSHKLAPSQREDVTQHVLLRLIETQFVQKFWKKAETAMPIRISGKDAAAMLGLPWASWVSAVTDPEVEAFIAPVRGSKDRTALDAQWLTKAVLHGAAEGWLPSVTVTVPKCGHSAVSLTHFRAMLNITVARHISNWYRLQNRRFDREIPLTEFEFTDEESSEASLPARVQSVEWETPHESLDYQEVQTRLEAFVRNAADKTHLNPEAIWLALSSGYSLKDCIKIAMGESEFIDGMRIAAKEAACKAKLNPDFVWEAFSQGRLQECVQQAQGGETSLLERLQQGETLREVLANLSVDSKQVHSKHQLLRTRMRG